VSSVMDLVAKRYAQALFNASKDVGTLEEVSVSLSQFSSFLHEIPMNIRHVLLDPTISKDALRFCIASLLESAPELVRSFFDVLVQEGRLRFVERIEYYFQMFLRSLRGESIVDVFAAYELSEDFCRELKEVLALAFSRKVLLYINRDPSLLGGIIIEMDGVRMDASILGTLNQLSHHMKGVA